MAPIPAEARPRPAQVVNIFCYLVPHPAAMLDLMIISSGR